LTGADLRGAYLNNANLDNTKLDTAYVQGAVGIPSSAGTPELFYGLGMVEGKQGRTSAAIENFNKALTINPEYAPAYLARAMAHYRLGQNALAAQALKWLRLSLNDKVYPRLRSGREFY